MSALREARVNAKLSITALAAQAEVSPEQIRNIETGRARNPRVETLVKLADVLSVKPSSIDPMSPADPDSKAVA